jgi:hypothetical protein
LLAHKEEKHYLSNREAEDREKVYEGTYIGMQVQQLSDILGAIF